MSFIGREIRRAILSDDSFPNDDQAPGRRQGSLEAPCAWRASQMTLSRVQLASLCSSRVTMNSSERRLWMTCFQVSTGTCEIPKYRQASLSANEGLNSLEKSRLRATKAGDFSGPPTSGQQLSSQLLVNNALHVASAKSDVPRPSHIRNYQILCRERTGVLSPAAKDAGSEDDNLKSSIDQNLQAESKDANMSLLNSSRPSLGYFGEKRSLSLAQNRNDFFNSLRKKISVIHSGGAAIPEPSSCVNVEWSLSSEQNKRDCADISMSNQEENHGDGYCSDASVINLEENRGYSGIGCGDGADASCVEKHQSQSLEDDLENKQPCSDCNWHQMVDLNEQDKAFLRLLGWKEEDEEEEALTAEEISTFIKQYHEKLRPYSKFWNRFKSEFLDGFEPASLTVCKPSRITLKLLVLSMVETSSDCFEVARLSVMQTS